MPNDLKLLKVREVSFVPQGANQGAKIMLFKMHQDGDTGMTKDELEKLQKAHDDLQTENADLKDKLKKSTESMTSLREEFDELKKSVNDKKDPDKDPLDTVPEDVKKYVSGIEKDNQVLRKQMEKLQKDTLRKEHTGILQAFADVLPEEIEKAVDTYQGLNEEGQKFVQDICTKAVEMLKEAKVLKEQIGDDNGPDSDSAEAAWNAAVNKVMKEESMTKALANRKVMTTQPELYNAYRKERG